MRRPNTQQDLDVFEHIASLPDKVQPSLRLVWEEVRKGVVVMADLANAVGALPEFAEQPYQRCAYVIHARMKYLRKWVAKLRDYDRRGARWWRRDSLLDVRKTYDDLLAQRRGDPRVVKKLRAALDELEW